MARRSKTGFDKFFDDQMQSPSFAEDYTKARAEVDTIDRMVRALDAAREKAKLTKAALATATGTRPEVVRRLFTQEKRNPTLSTIVKLAACLGYRLELVRDTRPRRPSPRAEARPRRARRHEEASA
jgi:DNA-binding phage protein